MDSINEQQPEQNRKDLVGPEALTKIRELVKKAETCFFCTAISQGKAVATRPMAVQQVDDQGNFWFLSSDDSHKNQELTVDPAVQLMFQGSAHSDFLMVYGTATVLRDKAKIEELWHPVLKTWFTEGREDPRITAIKVQPAHGYYWDTKHNRAIAFAKMAVGAVTGTTLDDSIEGTLRV